jgi:hypothetical protein
MDNEALIDETIEDLMAGLTEAFGIELTPEDYQEVVANTKTTVAKMEAERSKSTKKSKSKN